MISHSFLIATHACLFLITLSTTSSVWANPVSSYRLAFISRQTVRPYFPDTPASCPICASGYPNISTCAEAAPVLANFSSVCAYCNMGVLAHQMFKNTSLHHYDTCKKKVIFNPGAFISVIKCSCTDTFQYIFPQCADWFVIPPPSTPNS